MAARRSNMPTEPHGIVTMKPTYSVREEAYAPVIGTGPSASQVGAANTGNPDRRQSVFRRLSMSMNVNSRKSSMLPQPNNRPNTFRMEPDNEYRFRPYRVQPKVLEVLIDRLKDETYDAAT
ncbi:unnamed protein product, partial [Rotaria magnacalcarata]